MGAQLSQQVRAAAAATVLRRHLPDAITQPDDSNAVVIDCACGAEIRGVMPSGLDTTVGALLYVMADHLAEAVIR